MQLEQMVALSNWESGLVAAIYREQLPIEAGMFPEEVVSNLQAALMVLESLPEAWALAIVEERTAQDRVQLDKRSMNHAD